MKKSSLFVAMFLIAALVFTVSCPNNFAVNIVGDKNIEQEVTVDTESTFTFDIEVSNGAFLESAKDKAITVNVPADFDASAEDKAVVSATVTTLGEKDATTGKITKATVTVSFTAKKATSEAKELTFEIPASENPTILEGVKDKVTISGKKVLVTAKDADDPSSPSEPSTPSGPAESDETPVTATVSEEEVTFTAGVADDDGKKVAVTLTGGTFLNTTGITVVPTDSTQGASASHLTCDYEIDDTNKNVLNITVKATADIATSDSGTYEINIPAAAITPEDGFKSGAISKNLTVTVNPDLSKLTEIKNPKIDPTSITVVPGATYEAVTISVENAKFNKENISRIVGEKQAGSTTRVSFKFETNDEFPSIVYVKVDVQEGADSTSEGVYVITIPAEAITPDEGYKVNDDGYKVYLGVYW